jgi:hypothetical protein
MCGFIGGYHVALRQRVGLFHQMRLYMITKRTSLVWNSDGTMEPKTEARTDKLLEAQSLKTPLFVPRDRAHLEVYGQILKGGAGSTGFWATKQRSCQTRCLEVRVGPEP